MWSNISNELYSTSKTEPIFVNTKIFNQYSNINAQTSDENQALETHEDNIVVFDDILLSKQENSIDLFFTRGQRNNFDTYYITHSYFQLPKNTIHNSSNIFIFFKKNSQRYHTFIS